MRQDLVDRVHAIVGGDGTDDTFVIAELARAYDDLAFGSARFRAPASILRRESFGRVDEDELVRLAARRVLALSGTETPMETRPEDTRTARTTRSYARFSFGSRYDLPRENGTENGGSS
jgi:hypothetical protein